MSLPATSRAERGLAKNKSKIHGINPSLLIEKITREKIQDSLYYKQNCFGLNEATILDHAITIEVIGAYDELQRPTPFICLLFKLLQLQPTDDIINYYLLQPHFKYLTCLAILYIRLCFDPVEVYQKLEPLYEDYRKIITCSNGDYRLQHIDEIVYDVLSNERCFDIMLPRIVKRLTLEDERQLEPRISLLHDELDELDEMGEMGNDT